MEAKEWLKEGLINPNILIDTIEGEKPLWFILKAYHASQTEIPTDHESQAMRDYKNTRGSVHYHHGWTACYNWIKEYINKG